MRFILANLAFVLGWEVALRNVQCVLVRGIERVAWVDPERVVLPAESVLDVRIQNFCWCSRFAVVTRIEWVDHLLRSGSPSMMPQDSVCCVP